MYRWKRTAIVYILYTSCLKNNISLPPFHGYGFKVINGKQLLPIWDSVEHKTSCISGRCSCKRAGRACSTGCTCVSCKNIEESDELLQQEQLIMEDVLESTEELEEQVENYYDIDENDVIEEDDSTYQFLSITTEAAPVGEERKGPDDIRNVIKILIVKVHS